MSPTSRVRAVLHSVRFRITAMAAIVVAIVLVGAGLLLLAVQRNQLLDDLDRGLRSRADDLGALTLPFDRDDVTVLTNQAGDDAVIQFVDADGAVVAASANAIDIGPIAEQPGDGDRLTTVAALPIEDDEYRVLSRRLDTDDGAVVLHVAENTDDLRGLIAELRTAVLVAIPVAVLILCALVWWLVGRTLRPVDLIRSEVAALTGADLSRRVPEPGTGDEVDRLAGTMNEMLDRLERATSGQRRFVADASHELRSPLTRLRAELEVAGADATGDTDFESVRVSAMEEIDGLAALLDDLLVLARSDAGQAPTEARPVDLDDLVLEEVGAIRRRSGLTVDVSSVSAAHVVGDPSQLRRVVRNLLDNAVRHAQHRIEVELFETGRNGVRFAVADDGDGIPAEQVDAIFDRFTRLDGARSTDAGGTGLGLAIARDIVERHGGTISVDTRHRPGARFVVELPAG